MFIMSSSTEYPMRKKNIQKCENNEKMPFAASAAKKKSPKSETSFYV